MEQVETRGNRTQQLWKRIKMKRIRLKDANVDICVSIDVKTVFMEKASGEITQELERLETARAIAEMGSRREESLAREIALEAKALLADGTEPAGN